MAGLNQDNQRIAVKPVTETPPGAQPAVFLDRHGFNVAEAAMIQIARQLMMHRMRTPPMVIGRKGQYADSASDPLIDGPGRKKRAMAAIMLEREEAREQGAGGNGKQKGDPVGVRRHQEHDGNQGEKGNSGRDQLQDCLPAIGVPIEIAMGGK